MTQVFLTSASTSPWTKPGDVGGGIGHTVELIGAGGRSGTNSTGVNGRAGAGGGGGAYMKLTQSANFLPTTTAFQIAAECTSTTYNVANSTIWQGTNATNTHEAKAGLKGGDAGSTSGGTTNENSTGGDGGGLIGATAIDGSGVTGGTAATGGSQSAGGSATAGSYGAVSYTHLTLPTNREV